jgi:uncharacterized protein YaiI (UPF0178 family)
LIVQVTVAGGTDAADFAMVPRIHPGGIVVTNDTGLAAMALARGAHAVNPRGRVYQAATIDAELAVRHAEQQYRRADSGTPVAQMPTAAIASRMRVI